MGASETNRSGEDYSEAETIDIEVGVKVEDSRKITDEGNQGMVAIGNDTKRDPHGKKSVITTPDAGANDRKKEWDGKGLFKRKYANPTPKRSNRPIGWTSLLPPNPTSSSVATGSLRDRPSAGPERLKGNYRMGCFPGNTRWRVRWINTEVRDVGVQFSQQQALRPPRVPAPTGPRKQDKKSLLDNTTPANENGIIDYDALYPVQNILAKKKLGNKVMYKIRWVGYPKESDSWQPRRNLACAQLLADFERRRGPQEKASALRKRQEYNLDRKNLAPGSPTYKKKGSKTERGTDQVRVTRGRASIGVPDDQRGSENDDGVERPPTNDEEEEEASERTTE